MRVDKLNQIPDAENEKNGKIWPPAPTSALPFILIGQKNGARLGIVALFMSVPIFLFNCLDVFHSLHYDERLLGIPIKIDTSGYSGVITIVYFAGLLLGVGSWGSWQGKFSICLSTIALAVGILFPTFH